MTKITVSLGVIEKAVYGTVVATLMLKREFYIREFIMTKNYKFTICVLGLISMTGHCFADDAVGDQVVDTSTINNTKVQRGIGALEITGSVGVGYKLLSTGKNGSTEMDNLIIRPYRNASEKLIVKGQKAAEKAVTKAGDEAAAEILKKGGKPAIARVVGGTIKLIRRPLGVIAGMPGAMVEVAGIYGVLGMTTAGTLVAADGVGRVACGTSVAPHPIGNHMEECDLLFSNHSNLVPVKKEHYLAIGGSVSIKGHAYSCSGDLSQIDMKSMKEGVDYLVASLDSGIQVGDEMVYCGKKPGLFSSAQSQDARVAQNDTQKSQRSLAATTSGALKADGSGNADAK